MVGVAALLDEARSAGLDLRTDGEQLIVRGPKEAGSVAKRLLAHKTEIMSVFRGWGTETADLITWFEATPPPSEPFRLRPGVAITDPARYWEYLRGDIAAGPNRARAYMGAFQADLRRLYGLFAAKCEAA